MVFISALPYDYELPFNGKIALLIIDMQRDFLEPGGFGDALGNDVSRLQAIVPTVKQLLEAFRTYKLPVFQTIEGHQPDLSDCPPAKLLRGKSQLKIGDVGPMGRILILGEAGNAIIPELEPLPGETVIAKPGKGAFFHTKLESLLREKEITHLIVTGVTTEVCVQTTMREANDRGFECLLVEDATESYFPNFKQSTLEMIRAQGGIVGWTAKAESVIDALEKTYKAVATSVTL
ncbi:isochorismatase family cysteine hydrolase [Microcoleus sp. FACHB-68]|uniref:cysteine hydrolase family protein n=1 Tax=Microcoleus sp. FACHB-68 TaxID=2692826 RepID=UPI001689CCD4|nr:isochorismatase family cysteine hydrolase [Microcoleus sp. FACHB-68]MBD1938425.1 cysteine hydrolase [Microcoleus sp. FACHB-68]